MHKTAPTSPLMMSAQVLPEGGADGAAPEWIHLVPTPVSGQIFTADGRGPYAVGDLNAIIAASFAKTDKLEIDINHAQYIAAPQGQRSDAQGWITSMEVRDDGIWGRVEWTPEGNRLVADKAYRAISPVLMVSKADRKTVLSIGNASLVNRPNLRGLAALNQENTMSLRDQMIEALGLEGTATDDDILAALPKADAGTAQAAMQSAIQDLATTFGLEPTALKAIVAAAKVAKTQADSVPAMQSEQQTALRTASEAYVDGEIAKKRGIKPADRDWFVTLHMEQPDLAKRSIEALPLLAESPAKRTAPAVEPDAIPALNAEELQVAKALGKAPTELATLMAADRKKGTI